MLIMPLGQIVLARSMPPAKNGVNVIQTRLIRLLLDLANFDLDLAEIR
jgi:hypothetical protein